MTRRLTLLLATLAATLAACSSMAPPAASPAAAPAVAAAEPGGPPKLMLWVGNSFFYYNNSMHGHVGQLLTADGQRGFGGVSATISGSGLNWHDLEAHFKPGGVYSYSFVGDNEIRFNPPGKTFDAVLMMDCSQCPIHPQLQGLFFETARKDAAIARSHGAEPLLFMSWAYKDKPEMTATLAAAYQRAGAENRMRVVPAGLAFAESVKRRPELELYAPDKRHPSVAGTYLAACTVLATLYGRDPVGNRYTAGLPADVAAHLQAVARDTVKAFAAATPR